MNTSALSRYMIGGVAGALLATGIFDGPLSFVSAHQFFQPTTNIKTDFDPFTTTVDRSHKGDRLPMRVPDTATNRTIIFKNGAPTLDAQRASDRASPQGKDDPRFAPASLTDCEPLASPYADPALGRLAGRCFV